MKIGLYVRLCLMMFLQYAIWGAWMPVLSAYLDGVGFSGTMIGLIYCLLPLGILLSPVTGGQLAAGGIRFTDFHSNGAVCSPMPAACDSVFALFSRGFNQTHRGGTKL